MVAAPPGGVVVGTVVGATGHPAAGAAPGRWASERGREKQIELQTAPLLPTDSVVDVRRSSTASMFDAANAAKRRVHLCNGAPGTFDVEQSFCVALGGPFVAVDGAPAPYSVPWCWDPRSVTSSAFRIRTWKFRPGRHALIVTDKGVVWPEVHAARRRASRKRGKHIMRGFNMEVRPYARDVNAIAWDGLDVDKIEVRRYAEDDKSCYWNCEEPPRASRPALPSPLASASSPCCWKVLCNPTTPGLYRAKIASDHTTTVSRRRLFGHVQHRKSACIALARSPDDLESRRGMPRRGARESRDGPFASSSSQRQATRTRR